MLSAQSLSFKLVGGSKDLTGSKFSPLRHEFSIFCGFTCRLPPGGLVNAKVDQEACVFAHVITLGFADQGLVCTTPVSPWGSEWG